MAYAIQSLSNLRQRLACLALCAAPLAALATEDQSDLTRAGTFLKFAMPLAAASYSYWGKDDWEGTKDYALIYALNELTVEALKASIKETRPRDKGKVDFAGSRKSFPSGHAASAFGAAFFIAQRYGWQEAAPWLGAATLVGYGRVDAKAHYWRDVAASAAIAYGFSTWLTSPVKTASVSFMPAPVINGQLSAGVVVSGRF